MSLSPRDASNADATSRYLEAWSAINTMLENGRSLSGYERHCAFLNTGGERFADVSAAGGLDLIDDGRGVALVDWDFDGKMDLWVTNRTAPWLRLLHNRSQTGHHFVAVKLEGRTCNRSAIGARLSLHLGGESGRTLHKSVRAGEGFVAQSSKWVVFGLGSEQRIDRLEVRWPGTFEPQIVRGLDAGRHYRVVQGEADAQPWSRPAGAKPLSPAAPEPFELTDAGRIYLASRVGLPDAGYLGFDGKAKSIGDADGTQPPTLINLWAVWCPPCLVELKEWADHQQALRDEGVRVLALSVDELGDNPKTNRRDARRTLARLDWPFESGLATSQLVSVLEVVNRSLVDKHRPLPVPSSFLLDRRGRVAVIYRGPVEAEQVVADAAALDGTPGELFDRAAHFPGRWYSLPPDVGLLTVVKNLIDLQRTGDAEQYLQAYVAQRTQAGPGASPTDDHALGEAFYRLATALRNGQQHERALKAYSEAVRFAPDQPRLHLDLGIMLYQRGRAGEAVAHLEKTVQVNPGNVNARRLLIDILSRTGRADKTLSHVSFLVDRFPNDPIARVYLAKAQVSIGQPKQAAEQYRHAIRLRPGWLVPVSELAWLLATHPDAAARNGNEALRLAQTLNTATNGRDPAVLDLLAAAQAESGAFPAAVQSARKAIDLASVMGKRDLAQAVQRRLDLYAANRPYHAPAPGAAPSR